VLRCVLALFAVMFAVLIATLLLFCFLNCNSVNVKNDDVFSLDELMVSVLALGVCVVCWRCVLALGVCVVCQRLFAILIALLLYI
jgi:predicted Co/Zn/Cd cation transporter (cation efflux family)